MDRVDVIQAAWRRERPDLDVSPLGVIGRLHRLGSLLTEELLTVYRRHGLGEGEFDVLATLRRNGPDHALAPGELAAHTMVTSGAVSKRLDRLERDGLVRRARDDDDGRSRVVHLTDAGRRVIDAAFAEHLANEERLLCELDPDDRELLVGVLGRWLSRVEPVADSTGSVDGE